MPRIKASPKKCIKSNIQQPTNEWVFMLKGEALELSDQYTGSGTPDLVTLRHPNTGDSAIFLFSPTNSSVQEVLTFNEGHRGWFIDEAVKSEGKLHLSTPIDPIFLVLPYLKKHCSNHAMPLDQLLRDDEYPETERLLKSSGLKYLQAIADKKSEELNAYKYNEEKTLVWLKKKTERVAEVLKQKNIHVSGGVASATFIKAKCEQQQQESESYLRYATGIVSEYLLDELADKLIKYLNLPEDTAQLNQLKRKSIAGDMMGGQKDVKKLKLDDEGSKMALDLSKTDLKIVKTSSSTTTTTPAAGNVNQSAKEKARAKAATGSKSITSFFKKT